MPWYSVNTSLIIQNLRVFTPDVKQVWLADDSAGGRKIPALYTWYKSLCAEGKKFGYQVNGSKSWLIVKSRSIVSEAERVFGEEVNITCEGKRHLGAVVGSQKDEYCNEKIAQWKGEIESLSEIAKSQPHAAYAAFTKGGCKPPVSIPVLFGQTEPLPDQLNDLITLIPAQGGLGIPSLREEAPLQYTSSKQITSPHVEAIMAQSTTMPTPTIVEDLKKQQKSIKKTNLRAKMERIDSSLQADLLQHVTQARDKGASSWLNAIPRVWF